MLQLTSDQSGSCLISSGFPYEESDPANPSVLCLKIYNKTRNGQNRSILIPI